MHLRSSAPKASNMTDFCGFERANPSNIVFAFTQCWKDLAAEDGAGADRAPAPLIQRRSGCLTRSFSVVFGCRWAYFSVTQRPVPELRCCVWVGTFVVMLRFTPYDATHVVKRPSQLASPQSCARSTGLISGGSHPYTGPRLCRVWGAAKVAPQFHKSSFFSVSLACACTRPAIL